MKNSIPSVMESNKNNLMKHKELAFETRAIMLSNLRGSSEIAMWMKTPSSYVVAVLNDLDSK